MPRFKDYTLLRTPAGSHLAHIGHEVRCAYGKRAGEVETLWRILLQPVCLKADWGRA
jgi:hypothetical protein